MVSLTERAAALLEQIEEDQGLTEPPRIVREADGLTLTVTPPEPDDEVLYHGETPVLRLAPETAAALAGCTITTQETPDGTQLAIMRARPPNGRAARGRP